MKHVCDICSHQYAETIIHDVVYNITPERLALPSVAILICTLGFYKVLNRLRKFIQHSCHLVLISTPK